jgi:hypothetical protein
MTQIFRVIKSSCDFKILQSVVDYVQGWFFANCINFNTSKLSD